MQFARGRKYILYKPVWTYRLKQSIRRRSVVHAKRSFVIKRKQYLFRHKNLFLIIWKSAYLFLFHFAVLVAIFTRFRLVLFGERYASEGPLLLFRLLLLLFWRFFGFLFGFFGIVRLGYHSVIALWCLSFLGFGNAVFFYFTFLLLLAAFFFLRKKLST